MRQRRLAMITSLAILSTAFSTIIPAAATPGEDEAEGLPVALQSASAEAIASGDPVLVEELLSETESVKALPDGSFSLASIVHGGVSDACCR